MSAPRWLDWAQRLQAVAQSGLHYEPHPFDRARYDTVMQIAAEMIAVQSDLDAETLLTLLSADLGHSTPKIDVRGAVFRVGPTGADEILLVQEKMDQDRWTLPGGWADIGESAGDSVAREIREETGYHARPVKLLALFDRNKHDHPPYVFHAYKAFFRCELVGNERNPDPSNIETGEVGWFTADAITGLSLSVGRVTAAQIARFFEHWRALDLPTDFD